MIRTLKKQVKWRKDKQALFICDCKRLIDLKLSLEYEPFLKKLFQGLDPNELVRKEALVFSEFEKMNLLEDLKINQLPKEDFYLAMNILDNELGKDRVRNSDFLKDKFKEFPDFFIGAYLGSELVGVVCGFPREDYLLMSEIAVDSKFQRRKFGERLVKVFEETAKQSYNKIKVGSEDETIDFYKSLLGYKPFLLIQFKKGDYSENNFDDFDIIRKKEFDNENIAIEVKITDCDLELINQLRKKYSKAWFQYIFTKNR